MKFNSLTKSLSIAYGIEYLHNHVPPIVHGDLRAVSHLKLISYTHLTNIIIQSNVLIDGDGKPMISDFGLSEIINLNTSWTWYHEKKVLRWQSIELLRSRRNPDVMEIDPIKCDIYSFACLCLEACVLL